MYVACVRVTERGMHEAKVVMSPFKMAPAPRDRESEILKDSRWAFSGQRILWTNPEGKDTGLT